MAIQKREKIMIVIAAAVVLYFAVDFLLLSPMQKEIKRSRNGLNELEEKLSSMATSLHSSRQIKEDIVEKERFLQAAKGRMAGQEQVRYFLNQLALESRRLKFEILFLRIGPGIPIMDHKKGKGEAAEEKKEGSPTFTKVSIDVALLGTYSAMKDYLRGLEALPLFMEMEQVNIAVQKEGSPLVQMNIRPGFLVRDGEKT